LQWISFSFSHPSRVPISDPIHRVFNDALTDTESRYHPVGVRPVWSPWVQRVFQRIFSLVNHNSVLLFRFYSVPSTCIRCLLVCVVPWVTSSIKCTVQYSTFKRCFKLLPKYSDFMSSYGMPSKWQRQYLSTIKATTEWRVLYILIFCDMDILHACLLKMTFSIWMSLYALEHYSLLYKTVFIFSVAEFPFMSNPT
jgi:hypothetical protein